LFVKIYHKIPDIIEEFLFFIYVFSISKNRRFGDFKIILKRKCITPEFKRDIIKACLINQIKIISMYSKIKELIKKIDVLNEALKEEYSQLATKYGFSFTQRKIVFLEKFKARNKKFRIPTWKYAVPKSICHVLSMPFIYMMIVPLVILDIFITIYHLVAFPLYGIPKVERKSYIVYDRRFLDYLNVIQKINCLYCSYANGFLAYAAEIAGRTERYWCPIKAAHQPTAYHGWYKDFADYGNPEEWKQKFNDQEAFNKEKDCRFLKKGVLLSSNKKSPSEVTEIF